MESDFDYKTVINGKEVNYSIQEPRVVGNGDKSFWVTEISVCCKIGELHYHTSFQCNGENPGKEDINKGMKLTAEGLAAIHEKEYEKEEK